VVGSATWPGWLVLLTRRHECITLHYYICTIILNMGVFLLAVDLITFYEATTVAEGEKDIGLYNYI